MADDEPEDSVVHCPNRRCGLVFRPDPRIYRNGDRECPKCGTDFTKPPPWKVEAQDWEWEEEFYD